MLLPDISLAVFNESMHIRKYGNRETCEAIQEAAF
jgi:hypothetical protein